MPRGSESALLGVITTYRRPDLLGAALQQILDQDYKLEKLIVVDCDPRRSAAGIVDTFLSRAPQLEYLPMDENAGPAGGRAAGLRRALEVGGRDDWVMLFDDDDPPPTSTLVSQLREVAVEALRFDSATAAVGLRGASFDPRRARTLPVQDLGPALVRVDHLHGGFFPTYRLGVVDEVGVFAEELFYGFEELEYGLRLSARGWRLYMAAALYDRLRPTLAHPEPLVRARGRTAPPTWKRYYSLRNLLYILLRTSDRPLVAARVALVRGILKPLVNVPLGPASALRSLRLNLRAIAHAVTGRMGRTVDPDI